MSSTDLRFVINLHRATTPHFDLRLEADGTLLSWAVPKGPSLDPSVRRLAVRVDDHDLDQLTYEGRSTSDSGRVHTKIVWDTGTYLPAEPPGPAVERGHLRFVLAGHKLNGGFALTRTRLGGQDRNWILIKLADEHAAPDEEAIPDADRSVLTGVTNDELEALCPPSS
jgi:DNA ligase D-like protein (predicted 3'-phosphoesterase)